MWNLIVEILKYIYLPTRLLWTTWSYCLSISIGINPLFYEWFYNIKLVFGLVRICVYFLQQIDVLYMWWWKILLLYPFHKFNYADNIRIIWSENRNGTRVIRTFLMLQLSASGPCRLRICERNSKIMQGAAQPSFQVFFFLMGARK